MAAPITLQVSQINNATRQLRLQHDATSEAEEIDPFRRAGFICCCEKKEWGDATEKHGKLNIAGSVCAGPIGGKSVFRFVFAGGWIHVEGYGFQEIHIIGV